MHVALLGPVAPPAGGVQSHTTALRQRLLDAGHRVSQVAITRSERVIRDDVYYPDGPIDVLRIIRKLSADIIHIHLGGDFTNRLAALCAALALMPGARSVLTFHSGGFPSSAAGQRASRNTVVGAAIRQLDAVIAVNQEIADLFRRYGVHEDAISVIAPHANVDRRMIAPKLPLKLESFYQGHSPVFVSVGLLEPEYNLELQIDTLPYMREVWPNAGLVLVGSGSLHSALRDRISASGCSDHISLIGDMAHDNTLRAISDADVLLRTTSYDGDAVSVREALQLGTKVVASNTGMRPAGVYLMDALTPKSLRVTCERAISFEGSSLPGTLTLPANDELADIVALYVALTNAV